MAQAQKVRRTRAQEAEEMLRARLTSAHYSPAQVNEIVRMAQDSAYRNRTPEISATSNILASDVQKASEFLRIVRAFPRVPVRDIMVSGMMRGPEGNMVPIEYNRVDERNRTTRVTYQPPMFGGPESRISMGAVPSPVREYRHRFEVEVAGRTYTVDSNSALQLGGTITRPDQTDAGRLMALLDNRQVPNSDLRITDDSGNIVSRAAFTAVIRPRYRAIQQEFAQANVEGRDVNMSVIDSVDVSRVRAPRG